MGAYIIHFDDKPWQDLDDELYYRCFEIPWFSTTKTTISRLTPYTEDSAYAHGYTEAESKYREIRDELEKQAYQKGLKDAWEAARKIAKLNTDEQKRLFGCFGIYFVAHEFSASEAIEKIRQYEKEKEEQIQVGDEVENTQTGARFIVTHMWVNNHGEKGVSGFNHECSAFSTALDLVRKTGRHFPEIADVLEKMRGEQDG